MRKSQKTRKMELQSTLSSDERNIASCVAESALSGPTASGMQRREDRRREKDRKQRIQFMVAE